MDYLLGNFFNRMFVLLSLVSPVGASDLLPGGATGNALRVLVLLAAVGTLILSIFAFRKRRFPLAIASIVASAASCGLLVYKSSVPKTIHVAPAPKKPAAVSLTLESALKCSIKGDPLSFVSDTGLTVLLCNSLDMSSDPVAVRARCAYSRDGKDWKRCVATAFSSKEVLDQAIEAHEKLVNSDFYPKMLGEIDITGILDMNHQPLTRQVYKSILISEEVPRGNLIDYVYSRYLWGVDQEGPLCPEQSEMGKEYCMRKRLACMFEQLLITQLNLADHGLKIAESKNGQNWQNFFGMQHLIDNNRKFTDSDGGQCPKVVVQAGCVEAHTGDIFQNSRKVSRLLDEEVLVGLFKEGFSFDPFTKEPHLEARTSFVQDYLAQIGA